MSSSRQLSPLETKEIQLKKLRAIALETGVLTAQELERLQQNVLVHYRNGSKQQIKQERMLLFVVLFYFYRQPESQPNLMTLLKTKVGLVHLDVNALKAEYDRHLEDDLQMSVFPPESSELLHHYIRKEYKKTQNLYWGSNSLGQSQNKTELTSFEEFQSHSRNAFISAEVAQRMLTLYAHEFMSVYQNSAKHTPDKASRERIISMQKTLHDKILPQLDLIELAPLNFEAPKWLGDVKIDFAPKIEALWLRRNEIVVKRIYTFTLKDITSRRKLEDHITAFKAIKLRFERSNDPEKDKIIGIIDEHLSLLEKQAEYLKRLDLVHYETLKKIVASSDLKDGNLEKPNIDFDKTLSNSKEFSAVAKSPVSLQRIEVIEHEMQRAILGARLHALHAAHIGPDILNYKDKASVFGTVLRYAHLGLVDDFIERLPASIAFDNKSAREALQTLLHLHQKAQTQNNKSAFQFTEKMLRVVFKKSNHPTLQQFYPITDELAHQFNCAKQLHALAGQMSQLDTRETAPYVQNLLKVYQNIFIAKNEYIKILESLKEDKFFGDLMKVTNLKKAVGRELSLEKQLKAQLYQAFHQIKLEALLDIRLESLSDKTFSFDLQHIFNERLTDFDRQNLDVEGLKHQYHILEKLMAKNNGEISSQIAAKLERVINLLDKREALVPYFKDRLSKYSANDILSDLEKGLKGEVSIFRTLAKYPSLDLMRSYNDLFQPKKALGFEMDRFLLVQQKLQAYVEVLNPSDSKLDINYSHFLSVLNTSCKCVVRTIEYCLSTLKPAAPKLKKTEHITNNSTIISSLSTAQTDLQQAAVQATAENNSRKNSANSQNITKM